MNIDQQFQDVCTQIMQNGIETKGRTETNRIRLLEGATFTYDCSDNKMGMFTLRKNNPYLAISETFAFLMGASNVYQLTLAHPALKLWQAWASESGELGGVYGKEFYRQYPRIIAGLKSSPLSTHHRMTTLIPDMFPIPGNSYQDNVLDGRYSLMPCLHSYHFLSDGNTLTLHATQASGDIPVGVFPHNAYQVQFMLLLTAQLTGLRPGKVIHHVHDAHLYTNQVDEVEEMLGRITLNQRSDVYIDPEVTLSMLNPLNLDDVYNLYTVEGYKQHPAIKMKVDS